MILMDGAVIPLLPIGLFGFAWTSLGPPRVPWIAPMIFTTVIGIANVSPCVLGPCLLGEQ
jgi:hypothetical protein